MRVWEFELGSGISACAVVAGYGFGGYERQKAVVCY